MLQHGHTFNRNSCIGSTLEPFHVLRAFETRLELGDMVKNE